MKKFRILALVLVIALLVPQMAFAADEDNAAPNRTAVVLHTNDIHGYVVGNGSSVIGFDRIAAIKKLFVEELGENVILADAGDFSTGKPFASFTKGISPILAMNAAGYDIAIPGNHEFDFKDQIFIIEEQAEFDFISANITWENEDGELSGLEPYSVMELENGLKIAFIGVTTPYTTTSANPLNTAGFSFGDLDGIVAEVTELATELREECDIVVLLAHLGRSTNPDDASSDAVAEALEAGVVDVIIDGHSHTKPEMNEEVNGTWIVSTGGDGTQNVGVVRFEETEDGIVVTPEFISAAEAIEFVEPDEEVTAVLDELNAAILELNDTVVGYTEVFLNGERKDVRSKETNLGNTVADAIRVYTGADFAIQNGGSIRASIPEGDITYAQLFTTLPYTNDVKVAVVTGQDIIDALENGVAGIENGAGKFPQVSGLSYTVDLGAEPGERIVSVYSGHGFDLEAEYTLATNDFMAIGGDDYSMFVEPFKTPVAWEAPEGTNGSPIVTDIFAWYMSEYGASEVEGRIYIIPAPTDVKPITASVLVDGGMVLFDAYEIDGYNYFRLPDVAYALKDSAARFAVWENKAGYYSIALNEVHEEDIYEPGTGLESTGLKIEDLLYVDDNAPVETESYIIGSNVYYKLRDIAQLIDFGVEWDDATATISIISDATYVAP